MKHIQAIRIWAIVLTLLSTSPGILLAQIKPDPSTSAQLEQAIGLLNQGQPQAARTMLAAITKSDPAYPTAKAYDALCLYALGDKLKFLKISESAVVAQAELPPDALETFDFDRIDSLFFYRRFEQLLPLLKKFPADYPDSLKLGVTTEYQLAANYEWGMKKMVDANVSIGRDIAIEQTEGQSNLVAFLNLAVELDQTNYLTLTNRDLPQEIVTALTTLGNDKAVTMASPADREAMEFLNLKLYRKLQPKAVEDNLQRMTNFLNSFPKTQHRKRIEFDMADISFSLAEAQYEAAEHANHRKDTNTAANDRLNGRGYLDLTYSLQGKLFVDPVAGIDQADVFDREADMLHGYYLEKNYSGMLEMTAALITNSTPGDLTWIMAKTYRGITFQAQDPPDLKQSAAELDGVLPFGFKQRPDYDHWVLTAVSWRIGAARKMGDKAKAIQLVQWVQGSDCTKHQKARFMQAWSFVLDPNNTK